MTGPCASDERRPAAVAPDERLRGALAAAEAERTRWARELHDDTLQGLAALRLLLVASRRVGDAERADAAVDVAIERIEAAIDTLRGLIRELRPAALDELGLAPALDGLAERARRRDGIAVDAEVRLTAGRLPGEVETALYRIAQEALTNAVRHAHAGHVSIRVHDDGDALRVDVADDGRGFDPALPADGFGLLGIRERAALLHGALAVRSSSAGTTISVSVPRQTVASSCQLTPKRSFSQPKRDANG